MSGSDEGARPNPNQTWSDGMPLPRWALWLMLPGVVIPLGIFAFIMITERAHDETRCPFQQRSQQVLAQGVVVYEEARNCLAGIEEHRYRLERAGATRVLGVRRFDREAYAEGAYRWTASFNSRGEAQVAVHNPGHPDAVFREGTAEEHEKGYSMGEPPKGAPAKTP